MAAVIETDRLSRSFDGFLALDGLTIDVAEGEVLALLGPNGAGKTTTVRILNGVLRADGGSSRVLGLDPEAEGDALRRRTGVLTENAGVDERFTALENLLFVARLRGIDDVTARQRAGALLEQFGMSARADARVQGFSTGQRKRIALARALLHEPDVLFLDEPTSGLDPAATRDVVTLIETLTREQGRTVVLCTHFLAEASKLAHRVAVLHRGRLQAFGTQSEIAAGIWNGLDTAIDLGMAAPPAAVEAIARIPGVHSTIPTPNGMRVAVGGREVVAVVVSTLVSQGLSVYAAVPHAPTLEDIYFAVEARAAGQ